MYPRHTLPFLHTEIFQTSKRKWTLKLTQQLWPIDDEVAEDSLQAETLHEPIPRPVQGLFLLRFLGKWQSKGRRTWKKIAAIAAPYSVLLPSQSQQTGASPPPMCFSKTWLILFKIIHNWPCSCKKAEGRSQAWNTSTFLHEPRTKQRLKNHSRPPQELLNADQTLAAAL